MKAKYYILFLVSMLIFAACNKDKNLEVNVPSFNVDGYQVTDALDSAGNAVKQVTFNLEGNADVISFYSGETLRQYEFKDGRVLKTDGLNMSFDYFAALGLGTTIKENQISILASTDFNGTLDSTSVNSATWNDITSRFSLKLVKDITEQTSTSASIADLNVKDKPLYIAFRYITPPQTTALRYSTWDFFNITISQETILGTTNLVEQSVTPFPLYFEGPNDATSGGGVRSQSTASRLRFRGNIVAKNKLDTATVWAISPAILVGNDIDLGPDRPLSIKNRVSPVLKTYKYDYAKPGTYKIAFVAGNVTTKDEHNVVKQLEVVIP